MTTEMLYLTLVALLVAVQWLIYTSDLILTHGIAKAVGNRDQPLPLKPWAERAKRAHLNSVEGLVVFATVVLVAQALGRHTGATAMAAMIYFWARLIYILVYTAGITWVRTLVWTVGWICTLVIIWQILA
jgi:uncharacterized MAPEG superfamily protein